MKKTIFSFVFALVMACGICSCTNDNATVNNEETADTTVVTDSDSVAVDTVAVDTVAADTVEAVK